MLYFGLGGVLTTLVSGLLYLILPRDVGRRAGRIMLKRLFSDFVRLMKATGEFRCDLSVLDSLKDEQGPLIIAPSHPSLLDAVLVISRLPDVACIMKAKIWDNPMMGGAARLAGFIRNDSPKNMVRLAAQELVDGHQLLIFPEGTRTVNPPVNPFKGGFALIAAKAQAPVQTILLESDSPFLSKGWPLFKKPRLPVSYRIRIGERFTLLPGEDPKEFMNRIETYFREQLGPSVNQESEPTPRPENSKSGSVLPPQSNLRVPAGGVEANSN